MALAFARRWLLLFGALFAATVPFRYQVLPSLGAWVQHLLEAGLNAGASWLRPGRPLTLHSDSTGLYLYAGVLLLTTALGAGGWAARARRTPMGEARLWYGLHSGAAWFLALQLLEYGFDKVFKHQFYLPEPNTLYTPLGLLTPDLAYWSVMGASRPYSMFAGLTEVLVAGLLLVGRTRLVGGVGALGVLVNVLAINISFDISVKLWSGFLVLLAGVVAAPGLYTAYYALVRDCWRPARTRRPARWQRRWVGAVRGLGLGLLLVETAGPFVYNGRFDDDRTPRPPLHGAYAVAPVGPPGVGSKTTPLRLFVHRRGHLITQAAEGRLRDYRLTYAPGRLLLHSSDGGNSTLRYTTDSAGLHLTGTLGPDSVRWLARPLPWRRLPLLLPGHWTTDGPP